MCCDLFLESVPGSSGEGVEDELPAATPIMDLTLTLSEDQLRDARRSEEQEEEEQEQE